MCVFKYESQKVVKGIAKLSYLGTEIKGQSMQRKIENALGYMDKISTLFN